MRCGFSNTTAGHPGSIHAGRWRLTCLHTHLTPCPSSATRQREGRNKSNHLPVLATSPKMSFAWLPQCQDQEQKILAWCCELKRITTETTMSLVRRHGPHSRDTVGNRLLQRFVLSAWLNTAMSNTAHVKERVWKKEKRNKNEDLHNRCNLC